MAKKKQDLCKEKFVLIEFFILFVKITNVLWEGVTEHEAKIVKLF